MERIIFYIGSLGLPSWQSYPSCNKREKRFLSILDDSRWFPLERYVARFIIRHYHKAYHIFGPIDWLPNARVGRLRRRVTRSCRIVRDTLDSTAITSDNNGRPDSANVLLSSHEPNGSGDSDNAGVQYGRVQHGVHALVDDEHDRRDLSGKFGTERALISERAFRFLLVLLNYDN